jgi:hypothetical protein
LIGGELADLSANHRGDIGRIAVGGVVLGLMSSCALGFAGYALALKLSNYPQKHAKLAAVTWLLPAIITITVVILSH